MSGINLSEWALKHRSLTVFLMIVAVLAGIYSFSRLGRAEDPTFVIKTMVVQAAWPGASMEEMLTQVTERLERTLQETPQLNFLRSITRPGSTVIFVNLKGSASAGDVPDIWYHVRKSIGDMRHTLPAGVLGPGFNDEFGDTFGIIYGFTADGFTHRELRDYVEDVRSELLSVPDVSKIDILGAQDERIFVEISMKELANLGIDSAAIIAALRAQNAVNPAGTIQTGNETVALTVSGAFDTEEDIRNVNLAVGGRMLRLADIAEVKRGFADPPQPMFRVNGEPAIGLAIAMRDGGDILALGRNIQAVMDTATAALPLGITATLVSDQAVTVENAIAEFLTSLVQAVAIILAVSFISLGVRPGLVIALAIPLTLVVVFSMMDVAGIDMQRISLGALIIALALLVDDAMTTTDAMMSRLAAGDDKVAAATYAFRTYAFAMLSGTLVTIAGFVPVGFAASAAGEYTFTLFAVIGMTLIVSWFVAVLFAPLLGLAILKPPASKQSSEPGRVLRLYRDLLTRAMRMSWVTIGVTVALFVLSILGLSLVPRQFFPASDRPELLVDLALPQNASITASENIARRFDAALEGDPDVERWSTYVGSGAIRFYLPLDVQGPDNSFSQAVIVARDVEARDRLELKLKKLLQEEFPNVVGRVAPLELGPPVGWPVRYRVSGPDVETVRETALELSQKVSANPNVLVVAFDWIEPARRVRIRIDQDEARLLGLSSQALANVLNTVISGTTATQVRDNIYLVDVVLRATPDQRASLDTLRTIPVPLPNGSTVPLSQFASFEYEQEYPEIVRRDRRATLTVQADIARGVLPEQVVSELEPSIEDVRETLPPGYRIEVGGTVEDSAESLASVLAVVPAMLLIMFTVLMFQLRSFQRMLLVVAVAPLGLIGVVAALLVSRMPLGFVAILGVLALIGMITKNAVILIDQIDSERERGKDVWNAVVDASCTRFRPITLTAISTVLGMIPIAPTVFWGPMALSIMGGLLVGTILTLVFLPTLYFTWFGRRSREVEPAAAEAPAS